MNTSRVGQYSVSDIKQVEMEAQDHRIMKELYFTFTRSHLLMLLTFLSYKFHITA